MQPNVVTGAVLELHAARADRGMAQGNNEGPIGTWHDTSGSGKHGTLLTFDYATSSGWDGVGTLADPYRLVFDGTSDCVTAPLINACGDKVFTYEAWIQVTDATAEVQVIVGESNWGVSARTVQICLYSGFVYGQTIDDAYGAVLCGGVETVNDGLPHHLVLVANGTTQQLYVDSVASGVAVAMTASALTMTNSIATFLGWSPPSVYFPGSIMAARIYPFAFTTGQVTQNFTAGYLWPAMAQSPRREVDDTLWQIVAGDDASGWRDITDECGGLVYSTVMPGGTASISYSLPADIWGLGYNEVRADQKIKVIYAGRRVATGIILPRGLNYQGE